MSRDDVVLKDAGGHAGENNCANRIDTDDRGGEGGSAQENKCFNMNNYNFEDGKLRASVKWLIMRIYGDGGYIPDNLKDIFKRVPEAQLFSLSPSVIACMTNGSFYCQAASRIFKNNSLLTNNIGSVFRVFSQAGIDVRDQDGRCVTEDALTSQNPFNKNAHLLLIDALMTAHLRSIVSIEKVVYAISNYASVEKREEPLDCLDALLFWINKICLLVRDDVERNGIGGNIDQQLVIPEMEDLYEDLCDGTCICTLLAFYRPNEVPLQDICFIDPPSINDCKFNLGILRNFCANHLPWNPFHFEIEDILYLHESLQPNVNIFLADLFNFFEGQSLAASQESMSSLAQPAAQRRFMNIQPIPDLRSQPAGFSAALSSGTIAAKDRLLANQQRDRALSMASQESAITATTLKSRDSLSIASPRPDKLNPNLPVTHFGAIPSSLSSRMDVCSPFTSSANTSQQRPAQPAGQKSLAEIRLQMEEMRRQLGRRQQLQSAKQEQLRNETSKDAFFRVMSRSVNNGVAQQVATTQQSVVGGTLANGEEVQLQGQKIQQLQTQFASQLNMASSSQRLQLQTPAVQQGQFNQTSTPQSFQQRQRQSQQQQQHYATPFPHQQSNFNHTNANGPAGVFQMVLSPIGPPGQHFPLSSADDGMDESTLITYAHLSPQQLQQQNAHAFSQQSHGHFFATQHQQFTDPSHYAVPNGAPPSFSQTLPHHAQHQQCPQQFMAGQMLFQPHQFQQQQTSCCLPSSFGSSYGGQQMGMTGGIPLQPSFSQPSHLHLLHNPQQQPMQFSQQQQFYPGAQGQSPIGAVLQQSTAGTPFAGQSSFMASNATLFPASNNEAALTGLPPPLPPHHQSAMNLITGATLNFGQQQNQFSVMEQQQEFRLHQNNAPASRLDPQLELNRSGGGGDLTNWGTMTYRAGERPQRKTWAMKQAENAAGKTTAGGSTTTPSSVKQQGAQAFVSRIREGNIELNTSAVEENGADSEMTPSRASGFLVEDVSEPNTELTPEMQAKRRALLASQIRRKERIVARSEEKEFESQERRQSEMQKYEQAEMRKLEREQRKQKILEEYKRKKLLEEELGEPGGSQYTQPSSARMCASSTLSLNRGHSQPPFGRPKSQSNLHSTNTLQRPGRTQSNMAHNGQNGGTSSRVSVPSIAEPSLKLYVKNVPKSNRGLIMNALQYSVFPGHVSNENRNKAQAAIAASDSKHFLVLFRDNKLQYRGLYTWDQFSDTVHKIDGSGPKFCKESMMSVLLKYDSGSKLFGPIQTKNLSVTIDGFAIADQYWQKPKIPYSGR